jgi:hypothetical protein
MAARAVFHLLLTAPYQNRISQRRDYAGGEKIERQSL